MELASRAAEMLRRLFDRPMLLPFTALVLRSRRVTPARRFFVREVLRNQSLRVYRLSDADVRVVVRHGSSDVVTLGEVFHNRDYVPGPEMEARLTSIDVILDLGANVGMFSVFAAARWPQARIIAFEPDPDNLAVLQRAVAVNGLGGSWTIVPAAAGARDGQVSFESGMASLSRLAVPGTPGATIVPVRDVLPAISTADLVKIDIEGGEWEILTDSRFRVAPPRALVMEYHPHRCPVDDPRAAAESALRAAGMQVAPIWHRDDGHGMLWAWRT